MATVDRNARDKLAAEMRRFLDGETTAFAFDEAIVDISEDTPDDTVQQVAGALWFYYDDFNDHFASLAKSEWDCWWRLLLVLESDRHIVVQRGPRRWSISQLAAAAAFVVIAICAWPFGFNPQLMVCLIASATVATAIAPWRDQDDPRHGRQALIPFASYSEIRDTYRSVAGFRKQRYRSELADVRIRSALSEAGVWMQSVALWLLVSPAILIRQSLPIRDEKHSVVASV